MDKIKKFLRLLIPKEREALDLLIDILKTDYKRVPGLQPLKEKKGWFRIRMGNYRIIFLVNKNKHVEIKRVTRRNEKSYKNLY